MANNTDNAIKRGDDVRIKVGRSWGAKVCRVTGVTTVNGVPSAKILVPGELLTRTVAVSEIMKTETRIP